MGIALAAITLFTAAPVQAAGPKAFQFTASGANTSGSATTLDHPALNGKRNLKPVLTQYWIGVYNPHPVGLRYNDATARWQAVNEDGVAVPLGSAFNVLLAPGTKQVSTTPTNTYRDVMFFQTQKGNPAGRFLSTHFINPVAGLPQTLNTRQHSLFFIPGSPTGSVNQGRWSLFTEDGDDFHVAAFNVADVTKLKAGGVPITFTHTTSGGNTGGHITTITNPLTDGNPNAVVFVEHIYISGVSATYLDEEVAVYYSAGKWRIFNQETANNMPLNCAFVVTVVPAATP